METSAVIQCTLLVQPLEDTGAIPNNVKCPLLIYVNALALPKKNPAQTIEKLLAVNHWGGTWRNGIYAYHHYHSTAHEVLVCYHGSVDVQLGGEPGIIHTINAGDVILIPAGTGHKNLHASDDFAIVGGYPQGQDWDMCYGKPDERPRADENIARVPLPQSTARTGR
jgi:uncharacterized protein YjlB